MGFEKRTFLQGLLNLFRMQVPERGMIDIHRIEKIVYDYLDMMEDEELLWESDEASCAWNQVMQKISAVGSYDTVVFENRLIHAVIHDMGGWVYLCGLTERMLCLHSGEFKARYTAYKRRPGVYCPVALKGRLH